MTYRYRGHSMADPELYRLQGRDRGVPQARLHRASQGDAWTTAGQLDEASFAELAERVEQVVDECHRLLPSAARNPASTPSSTTSRRSPPMAEMRMRDALREALREEMIRDDRVFLMGEDIGAYGGSYAVTKGLLEEFGDERVIGHADRRIRHRRRGHRRGAWPACARWSR